MAERRKFWLSDSALFKSRRASTAARLRQPSLDFSLTGLIYCSMMMFLGLSAMNTQANLLFGVFGLMIGILFVSGAISRVMLRKLRVRRNLPKNAVVGEPLLVDYEISNEKRFWPSLSISVSELDGVEGFYAPPQCYLLHVAPKMIAAVPSEWTPVRRGVFELDHFQLITSFPFGFIKRAIVRSHKESVCVFPALAEVSDRILEMCRSADTIGQSHRPHSGGVDEFYGLREYRPGDSPRNIYWRRTARTGVLVTKELMRVSPPRLHLVVDTRAPGGSPRGRAAVERVIAMAASLANTALRQEIAVGLCAWLDKPITLAPARGKQHRDDLLTILARLPDNETFDIAGLLHHSEWIARSGTTLVVLTSGENEMPALNGARGGVVFLSASSTIVSSAFQFRGNVQFESPADSPAASTSKSPAATPESPAAA